MFYFLIKLSILPYFHHKTPLLAQFDGKVFKDNSIKNFMKNSIKDRIEKKQKVAVNITIDKQLYDELIKFKTKNDIKSLSPLVNQMLWDWLESQKKNNK